MNSLLQIHPEDNVVVAVSPVAAGETIAGVTVRTDIPSGHKLALKAISMGESVIKYGFPIGNATTDIQPGEWVHTHNLRTALTGDGIPECEPEEQVISPFEGETETFLGFLRPDGRAAVRNEIWILPMVGCVNEVAQRLCQENEGLVSGTVEGIYAFPHPYGCSQMGEDHARTRKLLAALAQHPNAGGVLVLSLGCENLTPEQFRQELGEYDPERIRFLVCQEAGDELQEGRTLLRELAAYVGRFERQPLPVSKLVVGLKCGGSDGLSGITANPAVGVFSDRLTEQGGSTLLTEVPEMFGAETILLRRSRSQEVFDQTVAMVQDFKDYYTAHKQPVYENPSPGNKAGGITTLEEKSCGCVQKGGSAPVCGVLPYGGQVRGNGLQLLSGPGNDLVSVTALTAAGAHLILFTTGRGTPFGAPAPTIKLSTNTALFERKPNWIDFDAGSAVSGESISDVGKRLFEKVVAVASGERTRAEENGYRGIAIFKDGVTL